MKFEESLLTLTEIESSSKYKPEGETDTSFVLSLYTSYCDSRLKVLSQETTLVLE